MRVDLHIHSYYSDSSRSPEEIVSIAKSQNVGLISICDHGTIEAYDRLSAACKNNGINCVPGIELSAMWGNEDLHMLAYNFDKDNEDMKLMLNRYKQANDCEWIVHNLSLDYPQISLDDYRKFDYPKEKGGWKYIYYAEARGIVKTYEEGYNTIYSNYSEPNHLFFDGYSIQDFCKVVKQANGVPVLAHPKFLYDQNPDKYIDILSEFKAHGIGGIECYYPSHTKEFTDICVDFCKKNDLRITCGSDCHGELDKSEGYTIGALDVSLDMLDLKGII
ncbi:MAG: PHP domain-containing protein [Defluviitaleaceae bacterium]|nr:PHP domain-containing protein [Defluviitaleaceae bacterium]